MKKHRNLTKEFGRLLEYLVPKRGRIRMNIKIGKIKGC
jgi:hypothetical protein